MPSLPALTIYLFGITALIAGLQTVYDPTNTAFGPQPASCTPAFQGNGLSAIAVGAFYLLAAAQENRKFFVLTLFTRSLTTVVFWQYGGTWRMAAIWEGAGVVLTGLALGVSTRP